VRLISYRRGGDEGYGVVAGDGVVDGRALLGADVPTLRSALEQGQLERLAELSGGRAADFTLGDVEVLPPIPDPRKIFCIGVNYKAHRDEASQGEQTHPPIFTRFADCQVGHEQPVHRPEVSRALDYEGELAVVIGSPTRGTNEADALQAVAGYSCFNDYSVRDWQRHTSQWIPGKNFTGVGSFGPFLVTADEVEDPSVLTLETRVNGEVRQQAPVKDLIFDVPQLIAYISTFSQLSPGDVIATGTPSGVAAYMKPPAWLKPGDVVEIDIPRVGLLRNTIA
jgi:2-keto-4-pentenoate hydratase/2-oxohepta-3-ene-1,7-dioic acid hydratase in catechol pathway